MKNSHVTIKREDITPTPKKKDNEPIFQTPWEARAFAMTIKLYENKLFDWEDFRSRLISEISAGEKLPDGKQPTYYESWLLALEKLLIQKGILTESKIAKRTKEFETGERTNVC